jgi:phosphopantothenoylcysteine decarboxylase/phosphopantothenate--cysteine ligase
MGMADDLLTAILLARTGPILAAPAMNDAMYANSATQANLRALSTRGWTFVGPETGALAEGPSERPGRMSEPEEIFAAALRLLGADSRWQGRKVVVSAGATREHLDPVRVLTNPSSGRMGYALAEAARDRGAQVVVVSGPTALPAPAGVELVRVASTEAMQRAIQAALTGAAALFMAAAPADYRAVKPASRKRPRQSGRFSVTLEPTPDILSSLKRPAGCVVVGFALETGDGLARARKKLKDKRLDYVVLNDALEPGAGFEVTTNKVTLLARSGAQTELPLQDKRDVARRILDMVEHDLT